MASKNCLRISHGFISMRSIYPTNARMKGIIIIRTPEKSDLKDKPTHLATQPGSNLVFIARRTSCIPIVMYSTTQQPVTQEKAFNWVQLKVSVVPVYCHGVAEPFQPTQSRVLMVIFETMILGKRDVHTEKMVWLYWWFFADEIYFLMYAFNENAVRETYEPITLTWPHWFTGYIHYNYNYRA